MAFSSSDLRAPSDEPNGGGAWLKKIDFVAIVKAAVIAFVVDHALMVFVVFVWVLVGAVPVNVDQMEIPLVYRYSMLLLGFLPFVLAGYLAAKFVDRNLILHAVCAGVALLTIYVASWLIASIDQFMWVHGITLVFAVPLAAAGGVLRMWQNNQSSL